MNQRTSITARTITATISLNRRLCNHILLRSCLPCLWKLSALNKHQQIRESSALQFPLYLKDYKTDKTPSKSPIVSVNVIKKNDKVPETANFESCPPKVQFSHLDREPRKIQA